MVGTHSNMGVIDALSHYNPPTDGATFANNSVYTIRHITLTHIHMSGQHTRMHNAHRNTGGATHKGGGCPHNTMSKCGGIADATAMVH